MFTFLQLQLQALQALQTLQSPGKENVTEGLKGEVPLMLVCGVRVCLQ